MTVIIATIIGWLVNIFVLVIIISAVLSFFMSPWHPVRQALDRVLNPLLTPIRRVIPTVGGLDFSPLVLLILVQIVGYILVSLVYAVAGGK